MWVYIIMHALFMILNFRAKTNMYRHTIMKEIHYYSAVLYVTLTINKSYRVNFKYIPRGVEEIWV